MTPARHDRDAELERADRERAAVITDSSVKELLSDIADDAKLLGRKYIELARIDLNREIQKAKTAGISAAMGGAVAYLGVLLLGVAASLGLAALFDFGAWLGFLIIGAVFAAVGGGMLLAGKSKASQIEKPKAIDEAKEEGKWIIENA